MKVKIEYIPILNCVQENRNTSGNVYYFCIQVIYPSLL